jgi:hypothetical protein
LARLDIGLQQRYFGVCLLVVVEDAWVGPKGTVLSVGTLAALSGTIA